MMHLRSDAAYEGRGLMPASALLHLEFSADGADEEGRIEEEARLDGFL
jgi:hypothetical protein